MARDVHENLEERALHRMLFFTDAVFAIVMTLLVLELHPPAGASAAEQLASLRAMGGQLFAFALSFSILAIFWVAHMATTRQLKRFDWPTALANLAFLFPVCLIPFVSAWVGPSVNAPVAWGAYSVVLIMTSLTNMTLVLVQSRGGGRLIAGGVTPEELRYRVVRSLSPGFAFTVGLAGAALGYVHVAQFCSALIPPFLAICWLTLRPREPAAA
ncbi:MAG: hypothetical protein JWP73_2907 [Phenylobacterium sp.]|nr:hypothetical protein [Phenylobacterium sp.]